MASFIFSLTCSCAMMLLVFVFLSSMVKGLGDFNINMSPSLSPFFDKLCDEVNCGRGNCSVDVAKPFNFVCQCDPGWKRTRSDNEDDLQFLPCVIPNCSLDYSCMPAPLPSPPVPDNYSSIFDPCYWTYCGEGRCTKNHTYTHTCECNPGYTNLMNVSHFPCFSNCALGSDCRRLGIRVLDASSPPGGSSQGTKFLPGGFYWIGITVIYMVMALWK
ncbi:protein jagged-1b-like isoform X2 [Cynara cardunculus var. scolymus]|uniref:protein jagged-1b-like isoform X2 n=1 Tax=Cynara cardunculus var. scolymus TaxID=59895 RepID=UPI000D62FB5B|nr:protein jagged-1b-like isoform X2 [Cynara cardunculus var. scolymus]